MCNDDIMFLCVDILNIFFPVQGYYRRATAKMALGRFKFALKDFEAVIKRRPRDIDAKVSH